jgi:hypothetical protein
MAGLNSREHVAQAVRNNAAWCDRVCRAHGRPGTFLEHIWANRQATPRFYPNAVTLSAEGSAAQLASIRDLLGAGIPGPWAVKDSFCSLELAPFGFQMLCEASWLWRPAPRTGTGGQLAGVRWAKVDRADELVAWEKAWSGEASGDLQHEPIFVPSLLADEAVCFVAGYQDGQIVAGAVGYHAADTVGVSNVFAPAEQAERYWAGCIGGIVDAFPGLPLVGYESGAELAIARSLGFAEVGTLRIWALPDESG